MSEATTAVRPDRYFDIVNFAARSNELADNFRAAQPFPHLVLDGLLRLSAPEAASFPGPEWPAWNSLGDEYQRHKYSCSAIEQIPAPFRDLIRELNDPSFLQVLEKVTGIKRLIPDPYLTGGGLHLSGPAGILAPHTDFHHYRALNLYRRINVLVYLNEEWDESAGGCLEFFDGSGVAQKRVVPEFGRVVVFATDDKSVHGFPQPVIEGRWRRSIALYYYTSTDAANFSGDETTYWREHGEHHGVNKARMIGYRALLNLSRGISVAAHVVNPNQGGKLVKAVLANRRKSARQDP